MTAHEHNTNPVADDIGPVELLANPGYRLWTDGRVESDLVPRSRTRRRSGVWHPIKTWVNNHGYECVHLYSSKPRSPAVHALMMQAFVGPAPPGHQIRHKDGNPLNNRLDNLCYGTGSQNMQDAIRHGTIKRGERHERAKLDDEKVLAIRCRHAAGETQLSLSIEFGVHSSVICQVCNRKAWAHVL